MNALSPTTAATAFPSNEVSVSPAAFRRVAKIVADEPVASALRISVEGGGCSGFSYKFDIVPANANSDDVVFSDGAATVLIDALSLVYMKNAVVDFVDDLMGQAFKITNPNAVASCGCGTSFSV